MGYLEPPTKEETSKSGLVEEIPDFSILKNIVIKEYRWTEDSQMYKDLGLRSAVEWQSIQREPDIICARLPVIYERQFEINLNIKL